MAMVIEVVICLQQDIKCRQETWQKAKHIMDALWFQLPCIIEVIHNQKCYCFKVSLPAYTLPHTKKLFYHASSSHHCIFFLILSQNIIYLLLFSWLCLCLDIALSAIKSRGCRFGPEVIHGPDIQFGFLWTGLTLLPSSLCSVEVWPWPSEGCSSVALLYKERLWKWWSIPYSFKARKQDITSLVLMQPIW